MNVKTKWFRGREVETICQRHPKASISEHWTAQSIRTICAWGEADKRTLYLAAQSGIYRIRLNIPGAAAFKR